MAQSRSIADLTGRGILVLGATTGIGRAAVIAFARRGARICFAGRGVRDGEAVAAEARRAGATDTAFMEIDIRRESDVRAVMALAESRLGRIEIAVNNAGVESRVAPFQEAGDEEFERVMGVNLRGTWLALKHEVQHMLPRGGGSIVNTASTAGVTGIAGVALYTASKHAIVGLTKAAALELAQSGIRINAIAPGPVRTGLLTRMLDGKLTVEQVAAQVPMGRISEPEEIAEAIVWLASDSASYVTGHTLIVDGGLTAS